MTWKRVIENHYASFWKETARLCDPIRGPVHELPPDFLVLQYPPHRERRKWTYATRCMSQPEDTHPLEIHMFSPYESPLIVELLYATAHYHRTGAKLGLWHTVNFGRPWLVGSNCKYGYISQPYLDDPALEELQTERSVIQFGWLIPITATEREYKIKNGAEALEKRFERWRSDYANPLRNSVA